MWHRCYKSKDGICYRDIDKTKSSWPWEPEQDDTLSLAVLVVAGFEKGLNLLFKILFCYLKKARNTTTCYLVNLSFHTNIQWYCYMWYNQLIAGSLYWYGSGHNPNCPNHKRDSNSFNSIDSCGTGVTKVKMASVIVILIKQSHRDLGSQSKMTHSV